MRTLTYKKLSDHDRVPLRSYCQDYVDIYSGGRKGKMVGMGRGTRLQGRMMDILVVGRVGGCGDGGVVDGGMWMVVWVVYRVGQVWFKGWG